MKLAEREAAHYTLQGNSVAAARALALGERSARLRLALPEAAAAAPADTRGLAASVDREALEQGLTEEELALLAEFGADDRDIEPAAASRPSRAADAASKPGKRQRETPADAAGAASHVVRAHGVATEGDDGCEDAEDNADDSSNDSSDDDEEQEAALMAELARVRAEREQEAAKRRAEEEAAAAAGAEATAATSNPLLDLAGQTAGGVRRRWDEDVVFRSQVQPDHKPPRRFINDTVRNDFHRSFMRRYVQ